MLTNNDQSKQQSQWECNSCHYVIEYIPELWHSLKQGWPVVPPSHWYQFQCEQLGSYSRHWHHPQWPEWLSLWPLTLPDGPHQLSEVETPYKIVSTVVTHITQLWITLGERYLQQMTDLHRSATLRNRSLALWSRAYISDLPSITKALFLEELDSASLIRWSFTSWKISQTLMPHLL